MAVEGRAFDNGIICHCGKKGCLETEASGCAIYRHLVERVKAGEKSILSERIENNEYITLEMIVDAINREDTLCIELLENLGYELGKHIARLMNLFNPEMVIVGGVLSTVDEYLILPIKTAIKKHSLNMVNKDTVVKISALRERAGMIGACMLARSRVFDINSSF